MSAGARSPRGPSWAELLWPQLGAALDTLENAVAACPEALWGDRSKTPEFWYSVFHALFFLDCHLSALVRPLEEFRPPAPFTLDELDPRGLMPDRVYAKEELLAYVAHCRGEGQRVLSGLDDAAALRRHRFPWGEAGGAELVLYTMRHVQHHAAQLNLVLRQETGSAPGWVAKGRGSGSR